MSTSCLGSVRNHIWGSKEELSNASLMCSRASIGLGAITGVALFIIACVGAAGHLSPSTLGWASIGLGGGMVVSNLTAGNLKYRDKILTALHILSLASIFALGSLGVTGVLSAQHLGYGLIGTYLGTNILARIREGSRSPRTLND
ncbi:MAG: hypothetical protein JSS62_00745 [Verrucomicrobia bacterium]|nr:hypothetical protein [Verrucomicrobiota bacterium]MBS0645960.1 hypothetical protein [Verrucomicrobiota bacterium]